ncbi:MAG: hypothetical protein HOK71_18995 [Planctomycetaceae bacterium]|nr:hypothetical protein [Planctomycetaceae bacterium]
MTVGTRPFVGRAINGATTEASPFWGQAGKRALRLNSPRKQLARLGDVPFLDRPEAVSLSFFYLNLHPLTDAATHGIVAKRSDAHGGTNYGINYNLKNDALLLYVNDGSTFRIASYSARTVLGYRRLSHLTATFEVADAPAPDADTDRDDLRIRLFLNGQPVKPSKVDKGAIVGADAWLLDVDISSLLNDAPLTLGSSTSTIEHSSGLLDEFLLYTSALSPSDAAALFLEVAGPNAAALAQQELQPAAVKPTINNLSLRGLQLGKTTRLIFDGSGLQPSPQVHLSLAGVKQTVVAGSNAARLIVDLSIPADAKPGYYPLRIQTPHGLSGALPIAVDQLAQRTAAESSREKPATLPAAFSGVISGAQLSQVYFRGRAGDRVVAEIESRRQGAAFDPVVEIKTETGTPLAIEWAKVFLKGDTRAEVTLPADGLYYAEVHDLSYKAPGRNPFRLVLGDVALADTFFPSAIARGSNTNIEPVGTGFPAGTKIAASVPNSEGRLAVQVLLPPSGKPTSAVPPIRVSDAVEVLETPPADGKTQQIDASFPDASHAPIFINGRIAQSNEEDRYTLNVTPGQTLTMRIDARSINSPLDARLALRLNGQVQTMKDDRPGSRDPLLNYKVPAGVKQMEVSVSDLYGRGGSHFLYRLQVVPAGRPNFSLRLTTSTLNLPADGTAVARLELNRAGYNGAVKLQTLGVDGVTITPQSLPAGGAKQTLLATLHCSRKVSAAELMQLRIVGESVGLPTPIRRFAVLAAVPGQAVIPGFEDALPVAVTKPNGLNVSVKQTPASLLKSITGQIGVEVARGANSPNLPIRLTLVSTEATRRIDPKNAGKGNKPKVRSLPDQIIPSGTAAGLLKVAVPTDVAMPSIEFVIRADVLPHAYSQRVLATAYSNPFRLPVQNAVSATIEPKTLNLFGETANKVTGTIKRVAAFKSPVVVSLSGLRKGFTAAKVTVPPGQTKFEIVVTAPKENEKRPLPRVTFNVTDAAGRALLPGRVVPVTVAPKPKK